MRVLWLIAVGLAIVVGACGSDDEAGAETSAAAVAPCSEVEEIEIANFGDHNANEFIASDYETNPPAGGDHNPNALRSGAFYRQPPPLGEAVHLLEHGAVIGWTNGLERGERRKVEEALEELFLEGYYQLATVENPELKVPFALSAWGALQTCDRVDTSVIRPFIERYYASPKSAESGLACQGTARGLPPC